LLEKKRNRKLRKLRIHIHPTSLKTLGLLEKKRNRKLRKLRIHIHPLIQEIKLDQGY